MKNLFGGLTIIVLGIAVGWYFQNQGLLNQSSTSDEPSGIVTPTISESIPTTFPIDKPEVKYTESGFLPNTITVKKGTTVNFINEAAGLMWVASDLHPTHQLLPGFDQLKGVGQGGNYNYVFTKVGTWKFHNHFSPTAAGVVVVTE